MVESRIRGDVLRTPIVVHPSLGDTGDGPTFGDDTSAMAQVKQRREFTGDASGSTLTVWAVIRVRPTLRVNDGERPPAPGDEVTVDGLRRRVASVESVQGPGTALAAYELTAGP